MPEEYYDFDTEKYPFQEIVKDIYQVDNLSKIHKHPLYHDIENNNQGVGKDSHSKYHKLYYDQYQKLQPIYEKFIKDVILDLLGIDEILYQASPTFRIHLPHNQAITKWHYDSDADHKHPEGEINFILPVTPAYGTNTVWVESYPGQKDYHPLEMNYGTFVKFNANKCVHGNYENQTDDTRISFDFRVMPLEKYDPNYQATTATTKLRYVDGEYYRMISRV